MEVTLSQLAHHVYVLGKSGMGKTTCLCNLCLHLMEVPEGVGMVVIDPLGALVDGIKPRIPDGRVEDVILFMPSDRDYPFALNPLAPQPPIEKLGEKASHVMSIFELATDDGQLSGGTQQLLRNMIITLLSRRRGPGGQDWPPALDEISPLLSLQFEEDSNGPQWRRPRTRYRALFYDELRRAGQIPVANFWQDNVDKTWTLRPLADASIAIGAVVDQFMANPLVRNVVGQTQTKIDFVEAMDSGKIVLADLSGVGDDNADFLGSVLMAQLASAALMREPGSHSFFIIADEISRYGSSAFSEISRKGRNRGVHVIAAQQDETDMRASQRGFMGNASNRIYFQLVPNDATAHAREFDATPPVEAVEFRSRYRSEYRERPLTLEEQRVGREAGNRMRILAMLVNGEAIPEIDLSSTIDWLVLLNTILLQRKPNETAWILRVADGLRHRDDAELQYWFDEIQDFAYSLAEGRMVPEEVWIQDRTVYPATPGTFHRGHSEGVSESSGDSHTYSESWSESESSETGMVFDRVPGRTRGYSDVQNQIANELTHLPRWHARCKLVGVGYAEGPIERRIRTEALPEVNPNWEKNWDCIERNTRTEYTRPRSEVEEEVRLRDQAMRRAVEAWHVDEAHRSRRYESGGYPEGRRE